MHTRLRLASLLALGLLLLAACGQSEPTATPSPTTAPTSTPTATPTRTPTPAPSATPTRTPQPTATPTAKPTATPTPGPTATPVSLATHTNDELGVSFSYPSDWLLEVPSPQLVTAQNSTGTASITVTIEIFQTPMGLDAYTQRAITNLAGEVEGLRVTSSRGAVVGGVPGRETQISFSDATRTWTARLYTVTIPRMGFVFLARAWESSFESQEEALASPIVSATLPGPSFVPPAAAMTGTATASDFDETAGTPIGVGSTFESTAPRVYAGGVPVYVLSGSTLEFSLFKVDREGTPLEALERVETALGAPGPAWVSFESEEGWEPGFYIVLVFLNGEVLDLVPFTIVMRHGEEFQDAQSYLDWSTFVLNFLGDYETVVYAASKAIGLDPALIEAYENRLSAHVGLCDFAGAVTDTTAIIGLVPEDASLYDGRGLLYWIVLDHANALSDLDRAIQLDEEDAAHHNNRALINSSLGNYEQAVVDATKAIELQPADNAYIFDTRAYVYFTSGDYEKAREDYEVALDRSLEGPHPLLGAGLTYAALGDTSRAVELLQEGLELAAAFDCPDPQLADLTARGKETLRQLSSA